MIALTFAATISAAMAWYGASLVMLDYASGAAAFARVPSWSVELILPVGFALLALRLLDPRFPAARRATRRRSRPSCHDYSGRTRAAAARGTRRRPLFALIAAIALLGFHAAGQEGVAVAVEFYRLATCRP